MPDLTQALEEAAKEVLGHDVERPILVTVMQIARVAAQAMIADTQREHLRIFSDFREILMPFMNVSLGPDEKIVAILIEGPDGAMRTEAL